MKNAMIYKTILAPVITEKATRCGEQRQFVFKVATCADKHQIKQAVEALFNVKVEAVQIVNMRARTKRFGQRLGTHKAWKKAYVSLHEGYDINFANAEG